MKDLDARLLAAHAADDRRELVCLYTLAAQQSHDPDASGFYLTHAYVYALELGLSQADDLRAELVAQGREE